MKLLSFATSQTQESPQQEAKNSKININTVDFCLVQTNQAKLVESLLVSVSPITQIRTVLVVLMIFLPPLFQSKQPTQVQTRLIHCRNENMFEPEK